MSGEFDAQVRNCTWDLVPFDPNVNIVGCKWVFTNKYLSNGTFDRHKARLVAKGFHQKPGQDFTETFSLVIKTTTIRTVLDIVVKRNWSIRQMNVNNAYLQGTLNQEVFMSQPQGFVDPSKPNHICRLQKAIYGLKQAPRTWYLDLRNFLLNAGFQNFLADTSLFVLRRGADFIYVLIYVDDTFLSASIINCGFLRRSSATFGQYFPVQ
ncbi:Retrovirus-related Pol polyprotein from transposon RE1 [Cardamine amara subsp. amara]|uniref:Retrovirus-related Pol polyprotein from transposon RE1 n=1 Tax=Cardamine amara subsp. amara TaxID=228776 RepID=A0ABD1BL27_CARAN